MWSEIVTKGTAAHGSRPDLGRDAIVKMGHVLVGLEQLNQALQNRSAHRLLGHGSLHASLIQGGQELSSYPEQCTLQVERRTIPGETPESVETEFRDLLERLRAADATFEASLKTTLVRAPFEIAEDAGIVKLVQQQAGELLSRMPEIVSNAAWMDSALLSAASIPTVVFGPGGAGAHAVVEWADLEQVKQCSDVLLRIVQNFCA